ncbi:MAG: hypothetical protein GY850_05275, partial [bacterium]|nr:hypothetical protein [bacterium]
MAGKIIKTKATIGALAAALLLIPFMAGAAEIDMGTSYSAEELAKVREWEKTWVGKKIDKSNIDQVADFMVKGYVEMYKNPEKWGGPPEGFSFTIRPYEKYTATKGMIEMTKKFAGQIKKPLEDGSMPGYAEVA